MPVIPYVPHDVVEPREHVAAIRARRGGSLLNLDRMLLHSPPFAAGWNGFLRAVRAELEVSPRLRELAICAVAVLNDADYEFIQHAPEFLKAGGTAAQLEALRELAVPDGARAAMDAAFDRGERAVIDLTVAMTRAVAVSPATMDAARAVLADDRQLVEMVGVIAAYNMVSRFLVALGVEPE
jgi:alkylhydroperoxidase family enzyme